MNIAGSVRCLFLLILTATIFHGSPSLASEYAVTRTMFPSVASVSNSVLVSSITVSYKHDDDEHEDDGEGNDEDESGNGDDGKGKGRGKDKDDDDRDDDDDTNDDKDDDDDKNDDKDDDDDDKDDDSKNEDDKDEGKGEDGDTYTLNGILSGLANDNRVVLQNNGQEKLQLRSNGHFTFDLELDDKDGYHIKVKHQPSSPSQTCEIINSKGKVSDFKIESVWVNCTTDTHRLRYRAGPNGSITGDTRQTVEDESDGSEVRAAPDSGFRFAQWSDDSKDNPRKDTNVTADVDVTAEFAEEAKEQTDDNGADEKAPRFVDQQDLVINATGLLTQLPTLTKPAAEDDVDGAVDVSLVTERTLFRPGAQEITWTAEDSAGNRAEYAQPFHIYPLISLPPDQQQPPGGTAEVSFLLNGQAPRYPLVVGYSVTAAGSNLERDITDGTVQFGEGESEQVISVHISNDVLAEGIETVRVSLDAATTTEGAANFGTKRTHTISIVDKNFAPTIDLALVQNGRRTRFIDRDGGTVTLVATVKDPNPDDSHTYDWQFPTSIAVTAVDDNIKTLDPRGLDTGLHHVELTVHETNSSPLNSHHSEAFMVGISAQVSNSSGDSDDIYRSAVEQPNVLAHSSDDSHFLIEADPGVRLESGNYALGSNGQSGEDNAGLFELGEGALAEIATDEVPNVGGYVDFQLRNLPIGAATARVVIAQRQAVPDSPVYRKFGSGLWFNLDETVDDNIASAAGAEGVCPPPGSADYRPGVTPGDWCLQLTLSDGGPNDADGEVNGVIVDPGGVGSSDSATEVDASEQSQPPNEDPNQLRTGGGGALVTGGLLILALLGFLAHLDRRPRSRAGGKFSFHIRSQRKGRHISGLLLLGLLAVAAKPVPVAAGELITTFDPLYLTANIGYVSTQIGNQEIDRRYADNGFVAETLSSEGDRAGWNFGVGYRATARFSLEISYVDLGEVEVLFESPETNSELASIHPESGQGAAFSAMYRYPVTRRIGASGLLGAFVWEGDFFTHHESDRVSYSEDRSTDVFYGLGIDYIVSPEWSFQSEIQRFEFDNDPSHVFSVGLKFRIFEWLNRIY